jgi:hypothetical protein
VEAAFGDLRTRLGGAIAQEPERLMIALVDLPYAVVRRHLTTGKPIPPAAGSLIEQAATALLT